MVQAGANLQITMHHRASAALGSTSPRLDLEPNLSGAVWCYTGEADLLLNWAQIHIILVGKSQHGNYDRRSTLTLSQISLNPSDFITE